MRVLHVFATKARLKNGYDVFHRTHGKNIREWSAYKIRMRTGEEHRFTVIRDRDDHYKVIGQRFDEIDLQDAVPAFTGDFLRSLLMPQEDVTVDVGEQG